MFNKYELEGLLVNAGSNIEKPIKIYMIGGCALSFKGLKPSTKDIDIIVTSKPDFNVINKAMLKSGFKSMTERESEFYATALAVYMKEESRIDVFLKQVGKMLVLTESMMKRSEKYKSYDKLAVYLVSNEDIFLFKAMTSREGDIADCDRIMRERIDYGVIFKEIVAQSKDKKWFFWIYEGLCRLEDYSSIRVSIKNKVFALVKKHWKDRPSDFMQNIVDLSKHIPDKKLVKEMSG